MGTKIVKWLADDGWEFGCEEDMLHHEADVARRERVHQWVEGLEFGSQTANTRRINTVLAFLKWEDESPLPGEDDHPEPEPLVDPVGDEDEIEAARR